MLQQCEACHAECSECTGALNSDCLACPSGKFLSVGVCKTPCPNGYYGDASDNMCKLCNY